MKTVNALQMRQIELRAIRDFGVNELILMENAGRAIADTVESVFTAKNILKGRKIFIFCGAGNNGGDGLVAARHLNNRQYTPEIILLKSPELFRDISLANYIIAEKSGIPSTIFSPNIKLAGGGLIVDALLGTGTKGAVREPYLSAIEAINASNLPVISVDIPSGLCADTGEMLTAAVKADITVTMAIAKKGLVCDCARKFVGNLQVADIGIPITLMEAANFSPRSV